MRHKVSEDVVAARVLAEHDVSLDDARHEVVRIYGDAPRQAAPGRSGRTSTPRATVVGALAQIEAERLGASTAGTGHYLLAPLTEGDSAAIAVLKNLAVDLRALRSDLLTALQIPPAIGDRYSRERDAYLAGPFHCRRVRTWHQSIPKLSLEAERRPGGAGACGRGVLPAVTRAP
jgi:ATP-dependent Clp protease ATP-binding subunit ClpA